MIASSPVEEIVARLVERHIEILAGLDERNGAVGKIRCVYFHDPDGNLVEVSNQL